MATKPREEEIKTKICNVSGIKREWLDDQISQLLKKGLSKAEIARQLDILPQQLNNILHSKRGISDKFLNKFMATFNINQSDLYSQLLPDPEADSIYKRLLQIFDKEMISVDQFMKNNNQWKLLFENALHWDDPKTAKGWVDLVLQCYPKYCKSWVLTGEGPMLIMGNELSSTHKIPLYDTQTIGGNNEISAPTGDSAHVSEWIDAGDWFPQATAAIHHYGDSMLEYPSGSILVLKVVNDRSLIVNGQTYVIETDEYRVTKIIQDEGEYLMAYSTNQETMSDGSLRYRPFKIPKASMRRLFLVIGCVLKEFANKPIPIK